MPVFAYHHGNRAKYNEMPILFRYDKLMSKNTEVIWVK